MSKDQKNTINLPVEIVENLIEKLELTISELKFWHYENIWPMNLIKEVLQSILDKINY